MENFGAGQEKSKTGVYTSWEHGYSVLNIPLLLLVRVRIDNVQIFLLED